MVRLIVVILVLVTATPAMAQSPLETVRRPLEAGIQLLRDPTLTAPDQRVAQRDRIWETIRDVFDFRVVSALAVGPAWREFTQEQRTEFIALFAQLLGNTYVSKIQGSFNDEQVVFLGEELLPKQRALVKSHIVRGEQRIAVDYALREKDSAWKVYDVRVEGVSLVLNYRNQFMSMLAKPDATAGMLIERVKEKLAEMEQDTAQGKSAS